MYRLSKIFFIILLSFILSSQFVQAQQKQVFVMEIREEIDPRMSRYVKLALNEAKTKKSDLVIIDMDTFGGALEDADKIRKMVLEFTKPIYVYINKNAASAGALISIACDSIYMSEGANIGAATVVNGSDGSAAPDKYQSYMRSLMRSTAEVNHRNPLIAEAMVDSKLKLDSTIKKDGQVITFTTSEAIRNGYCEAQVSSVEDLLSKLHTNNYKIERYEKSFSESIISFFMNPAISGILILAIIAGIYYEMQAPGIGFPLFVAIVAAILYLTPYYLNGLAENWEILVLVAGIGLLGLEIFVIPGFGITGIAGIALTFVSLVLIMLNNDFLDFTFVPKGNIIASLTVTLAAFIGSMAAVIFGGQFLLNSKAFKKLSLQETLQAPQTAKEIRTYSHLVHQTGIAYTVLRPSGKVKLEGEIYDATSITGDYILANEPVVVVEVNNSSLRVKKV